MNTKERVALSNMIKNHFNIDEIKDISFNLGLDFDNISGPTRDTKIVSLIQYHERRNTIVDLAKALGEAKPNLDLSHWGGPNPVESLHAVLRQLLTDALSSTDVMTCAFDLFPSLYDEVGSNRRMIELIVENAISNNVVKELMDWIHKRNPYQYGQYWERVKRAWKAYKEQQHEAVPNVPQAQPRKQVKNNGVDNAVIIALKFYARGNNDGGEMAKDALEMIGVTT